MGFFRFWRPTPTDRATVAAVLLTANEHLALRDICRAARLSPVKVGAILASMMSAGWLIDDWADAPAGERPERRHYIVMNKAALQILVGGK